MGNMKNKFKVFLDNSDEGSTLFWMFIFALLLVRSVIEVGFALEQLKYIFYAVVMFLVYIKFSIIIRGNDKKTIWDFLTINSIGLILTYKEFFNE